MSEATRALEEKVAHLERVLEEVSGVVAGQADEIALLTRRVTLLLEREAAREAEAGGAVHLGDERPPHW